MPRSVNTEYARFEQYTRFHPDMDLEFISISLDDKEQAWRKMLNEENLPWVMLWNEEGFSKDANSPNKIQQAYGFNSIPFIVLIDKEGKILARNLRGDKVREAILEARKQ